MRLVSFRVGSDQRFGAVVDGAIRDLTGWAGHPTLRSVLRANALPLLGDAIPYALESHRLDAVELLPPIPFPDKCLCVGVNYAAHRKEHDEGDGTPLHPSLSLRVSGSFVGHSQPIIRPAASAQLDYEGAVACVIGRGGRHIARDAALAHVAGVTLCNDGSVRNRPRSGRFDEPSSSTQEKNWDRSGSLGPWMVTTDELDPSQPLTLTTRVNGEVRQHDTTARLAFPLDALIHYISTFTTLQPGDVIVTGTPTGAGASFDPPRWLVPGDRIDIEVDGIGTLSNTVAEEAPA